MSRLCTLSISVLRAVSMSTGTLFPLWRNSFKTFTPFILGSMMSRMITSGSNAVTAFSPEGPSYSQRTFSLRCCSCSCNSSAIYGSSSTTSMRVSGLIIFPRCCHHLPLYGVLSGWPCSHLEPSQVRQKPAGLAHLSYKGFLRVWLELAWAEQWQELSRSGTFHRVYTEW